MNTITLFSCLSIATCASTSPPQPQMKQTAGWSTAISGTGIPEGQDEQGYSLGRDSAVTHNGHASYTIKSLTANTDKWRCITQGVRAEAFRGKRIRLRGYLKTKDVSTFSGLWMRIDAEYRDGAFDNMGNRPIKGTTGWTQCNVVLDVPNDAVLVFFGALTSGTGQMWLSDLSLEAVSQSVPATAGWLGPDFSHDPLTLQNLDFRAKPQTESKLDIPDWMTSTGDWGDQLHLDLKSTHNGKPSAEMRPAKGGWDTLSIWQQIKAAPYRGKKIEYRVFVKTDGAVSGGPCIAIPGGGQWLVADIPKFVKQGKKWVDDKREWKPVSVVALVPDWANCIQIGVQLNSTGHVWVSDASFRVVPSSTTVTYGPQPQREYTASQIAGFPAKPVNLNFTR